jgi:hypothetical protein
VQATLLSIQQLQANHDVAIDQWRLEVERVRYEAQRAERRYRSVEPENRLVARGLETEWESRLRDLASAEAELRLRERQQPGSFDPTQLKRIELLGSDIRQVWNAPTTTDRDRKELLRALLEEVILNLKRAEGHAHLTLRWRGGAITMLDVPVPRFRPMGPRTDEDTISLLRRLATLYPDEIIAGILNRQERKTATGERFTANQVGSLRRSGTHPIPDSIEIVAQLFVEFRDSLSVNSRCPSVRLHLLIRFPHLALRNTKWLGSIQADPPHSGCPLDKAG